MRIQKGRPKFGYRESWDAPHYLSPIIHAWLTNFQDVIVAKKESGHGFIGIPGAFHSDDSDEAWDASWEAGWIEWQKALDEMLYAFADNEPKCSVEFTTTELESGRFTIEPDDAGGYEQYKLQMEEHEARVLEGRNLFAKHFGSLWW